MKETDEIEKEIMEYANEHDLDQETFDMLFDLTVENEEMKQRIMGLELNKKG